MHTKTKPALIVVLAIALLLPSYAGAAGTGEGAAAEPMVITWSHPYEDSWFLQHLNEMFNVTVKGNGIVIHDRDKQALMFAAGEAPDAFSYWKPVTELYDEGIIQSLPIEAIRTFAPNYSRTVDERPVGWLMHQVPDKEDHRYGIATLGEMHGVTTTHVSFRMDYARKLGFDLETYDANKRSLDDIGRVYWLDESKDLQWFEDLLVAFRDGDPDGNGKNDHIPMAANQGIDATWHSVLGAFGLSQYPDYYYGGNLKNYEEDGEFHIEIISPRWQAFLKHAAKWYAMGLVDREFPTLSLGQMRGKVEAGRIGVYMRTRVNYVPRLSKRPPNSFATEAEVAQGAEVVAVPAPIGPGGFQGTGPDGLFPFGTAYPLVVNRKVDEAKRDMILQIEDYAHWTDEGRILYRFGKEGVFWDWAGEPYQSAVVRRDPGTIPSEYLFNDHPDQPQFSVTPHSETKDMIPVHMFRQTAQLYLDVFHGPRGQELRIDPHRYDLLGETTMTDLITRYGEELQTLAREFYFKAVTGEIDVDAEWDGYVSEWLSNGGQEMLAEMRKAPLVEPLLEGRFEY